MEAAAAAPRILENRQVSRRPRTSEQFAADQHAADFARARADFVELRVTPKTSDRILVDIAVAAEDLDGFAVDKIKLVTVREMNLSTGLHDGLLGRFIPLLEGANVREMNVSPASTREAVNRGNSWSPLPPQAIFDNC